MPTDTPRLLGSLPGLSLLLATLGLAGCAVNAGAPTNAVELEAVRGSVHGGQQPVSGATVELIAPGTTGYGSAGSVLATATTAADGSFALPSSISCPSGNTLVYLLATGGNAGAGTNAYLAEAAVVGPCASINSSSFFSISEVTTVAAAYVLAPFATVTTGVTSIGTSATNLQGLGNAYGTASNLVNLANGAAHVTADLNGIVPPTAELNTLADILSACVNQGTSLAPSNGCASLFGDTTPSSGVAPTDTFQAAINLAKNPALSNTPLFNLVTSNAPYQPTLSSAPGDFTVALGYNGGAITTGNGTVAVAIDGSGDAWFSTGNPGVTNYSLTEISPAGVYLSGSTVAATTGFGGSFLNSPIGVAIDASGNVIVANNGDNNVVKVSPAGALLATFTSNSLGGPNDLSLDGSGNIWVANFTNNGYLTTVITPSFTEATESPVSTLYGATSIAAGPTAVWVSSHNSGQIARVDLSTFAVNAISLNNGDATAGVAIDHSNHAFFADISEGVVFAANDSPTTQYGAIQTGNSIPQSLAIDGLGNVFAASFYYPSTTLGRLQEFNNALTTPIGPTDGYIGANLIPPYPSIDSIAIDGSGNVWIAGNNAGTSLPVYATEVIGIAAPVVTPHATAVTNNTLGTRP